LVGKWAVLFIKAFCAAIVFAATLFTILTIAPAIETRFAPVVSKLRITKVMADDAGNSIVYAEFTKLRDCEYIGLSWYHGDPRGEFERVPVVLLRKEGDTASPNRPLGTQKAGPWIVSISPAELRGNSFARLSHRCNFLWLTNTDFLP
jgi:hypothetical protein